MSACWTIAPIPPSSWEVDGLDTTCVSDICRIDNAVLARAILGYAMLGVPCDDLYEPPPPAYDTTAVSQQAISGVAISGSSTGLVVITR
jgi:hypothetical protein